MTRLSVTFALGAVAMALLAGCAPANPKVKISPEAEAALPAGTDIRNVRRLSNGCYFVLSGQGLSGFTAPLVGADGKQVCDPVAMEDVLNPNRLVYSETAV